MYLFLITFILLYSGLHLYIIGRVQSAFRLPRIVLILLFPCIAVMTLMPVLIRIAERYGFERTAAVLALPGYLWLGFIFILFSLLLFADIIQLPVGYILRRFRRNTPSAYSARNVIILVFTLSVAAGVYSCFEALHIRSDHITIYTDTLPASISRIRIVQLSDVHVGLLMQDKRLNRVVETVKNAKPDILISTGDLVDGKLNRDNALSGLDPLASLLASIPAPRGKFAVLGNHEVYAGLSQSVAFTQASGFTVLRDRAVKLICGITVAGLDDQAVYHESHPRPEREEALLRDVTNDTFRILLKHRPDLLPQSDGRFDLQLSGHVHGGQIFPFNLLVRLKHPIPCGTTLTKLGSRIHVSRGTGTWGPPMRLFAPPEITIIDLAQRPFSR